LLVTRLAANPSGQLAAPPLGLEQIKQIARAQNTTLVEYSILYDDLRFGDFTLGEPEAQPTQLLTWVIRPTGQIAFRQTDLKRFQQQNLPLRDLVRAARRNLGALGRGEAPLASGDRPPIEQSLGGLKRLYQLLIEPIADLLPRDPTARVTFIPQDALFLAPFAALQDRNGQYLIEQHTILLAPSMQALALLDQRRSKLAIANALVVGNPTMPKLKLNPNLPPESLPDLPGAEAEARAIAQLLHTQPLIGNQATEVAITQKISQADIVHLATHGILDNIRGLQSSLALAPTGNQTAATDGFLTAREVLKLNLKANLVVLSACDTGRGTINGDGVVGLSRSFMAAGTPSIVVSLWSVPDTPTAELMKMFYLNLGQGMDKAQALRQAMLSTMKQHPKPLDWAGFILLGVAE
jgi:CHAT domain-containing protein